MRWVQLEGRQSSLKCSFVHCACNISEPWCTIEVGIGEEEEEGADVDCVFCLLIIDPQSLRQPERSK